MISLDDATHIYYGDDDKPLPLSVTRTLELAGIIPPFPDNAHAQFYREQARKIGTSTHEWTEEIDRRINDGQRPDIEPLRDTDVLDYVAGYIKFLQEHDVTWDFFELGWSREDCGGTLDRIGEIDDYPVIADIKTASSAKPWWQLQLTGYKWLWLPEEDFSLVTIHLSADRTYKLSWHEPDFKTWEGALNVARWKIRR
jgi:hypothetical protein